MPVYYDAYGWLALSADFYQFYSAKTLQIMRKESDSRLESNSDLLKEKQRMFANVLQTEPPIYSSQSIKPTQKNSFQTLQPFQPRSFLATVKSQEYTVSQDSKSLHGPENPQKLKSSSLHEKFGKANKKFEYLAYVQRQYKQQKEKKGPPTEGEGRIRDQILQIKLKLENYYEELQRKDEMIVKREKELFDLNKKLESVTERAGFLEQQCRQLQQNNQVLYEQCLRYQQNEEYNSKLADNYHILSEKCMQIEGFLQQKDAYLQNQLASKDKQYQAAVASKNQQIRALEERIAALQGQNTQLSIRIKSLMAAKPKQQMDVLRFQAFGQEFEAKINFYVNENSKLKNLIGHYQGQFEQLRMQQRSLENTIRAYQDRDRLQKSSKVEEQLYFLRDALEKEKMEKDQMVSRHELQILKLENTLSAKKLESEGTLINFYDKERLRENLYLALEDVVRLNRRLSETAKR